MKGLHVISNTRYLDPHTFICPPDLAVYMNEGEAHFGYTIPLTAKTGAELRALADEADRVWADYAATQKTEQVPA